MSRNSALKKIFFFFIFLHLWSGTYPLCAQENVPSQNEKEKLPRSVRLLHLLKEGVLIVRLTSEHRKITALQHDLAQPGISDKTRRLLKKMLNRTIENNRRENEALLKVFLRDYDFSKVLFMYDTSVISLKNGIKSGYFLNHHLIPDPGIRLETDNWLLIWFRPSGPAAFFLHDSEFNEVKQPFPQPKRPIFRNYRYLPLTDTAQEPISGFSLIMTYDQRRPERYLSATIAGWNKKLRKVLMSEK